MLGTLDVLVKKHIMRVSSAMTQCNEDILSSYTHARVFRACSFGATRYALSS